MVKMCSVPLCKGVASKQNNVKLHKFPASEELRQIWLDRIKSYYPNFKISDSSLVCSNHFTKINFLQTARSKTFSICNKAVPSLFDVEQCVYVFNDSEQDCSYNIPSPSNVSVMEVTPTNVSGIMDTQLQVTPKRLTNTTIDPAYRKSLFGDFKADDLNTPRKRKRYWEISQKTVNKYKIKTKMLHNKNAWLRKRVKILRQLVHHLKEERKFSDSCFSVLKESLPIAQREMVLKQLNCHTEKKISPELRAFALTLHFYSAAAYKYERQVFNKCLPHPSTLRKWYAVVDGSPGFTKESMNAIQIKVAEMKLNH